MEDQRSIRENILLLRKKLSPKAISEFDEKLRETFIKFSSSYKLKKVGLYYSVKNESPISGIQGYLKKSNIKCYLPAISNNTSSLNLKFGKYIKGNKLKKNIFGIPEPDIKEFINPLKLDLVLVPLVAFDKDGFRIGMGKGYYDKTFENKKMKKSPLLWGLAYDFQEVFSCFPSKHDIKLDAVLCPENLRNFI